MAPTNWGGKGGRGLEPVRSTKNKAGVNSSLIREIEPVSGGTRKRKKKKRNEERGGQMTRIKF